MKNEKWLMPSYYPEFACKCDECRHSCCHGWKIPVSEEEYYRLINLECDKSLRQRIDHSFEIPKQVSAEHFRVIAFNYLGDCPIQKDGLCSLQTAKGEQALPKVCRLFPRALKRINDTNVVCCSSSCEKVVELLRQPKAMALKEMELPLQPSMSYTVDGDFVEELRQTTRLLQKPGTPLKERLASVCQMVDDQGFEEDLQRKGDALAAALTLLQRLCGQHTLLADLSEALTERYRPDPQNYRRDAKAFETAIPDWENWFENVLNNSLFFENFPFVDPRFDHRKAYKGLCASYGLMRLVSIGSYALSPSVESVTDGLSALFHLIDHTAFYYNVNVLLDNAALFLDI